MVFNLEKSVESITTKRELSTPMEWSRIDKLLFQLDASGLTEGLWTVQEFVGFGF